MLGEEEGGLKGFEAEGKGDKEGREAEVERVKEEVLNLGGAGFGLTGGGTPPKEGTEKERTPPGRLVEIWGVVLRGGAGLTGLPSCELPPRKPGAWRSWAAAKWMAGELWVAFRVLFPVLWWRGEVVGDRRRVCWGRGGRGDCTGE